MSTTENLLTDFLTQREAAAELKICERTLDRWRRLGEGPRSPKLGVGFTIDAQPCGRGCVRASTRERMT